MSIKWDEFIYHGIYVGDERVNNVRVKCKLRKGQFYWVSQIGLQFDLETGKFEDHDQKPLWRLLVKTIRPEREEVKYGRRRNRTATEKRTARAAKPDRK